MNSKTEITVIYFWFIMHSFKHLICIFVQFVSDIIYYSLVLLLIYNGIDVGCC